MKTSHRYYGLVFRSRLGTLAAGGLLLGLLAGCSLPGATNPNSQPTPAKAAPAFSLATLDGRQLGLADLRGKVALVNFWATWCIPCRAEIPDLEHENRVQDKARVAIVGIDWKEPPGPVQSFIHDIGATYPILFDADGKIYDAYGVAALPQTYVLNAKGDIVSTRTGIASRAQIESELKAAGG
jgi:peroxiredoxin